uniref:Uncharacterized protein n=1 Tax=Meloidogyne enterolobii TaxID=390850 RepID=A0A6V7TV26_MELEN|nr:unnamed protein product [Meloidogyne enterolobii]
MRLAFIWRVSRINGRFANKWAGRFANKQHFTVQLSTVFLIIKCCFLNNNNFPCSINNFSRCWKSCSRETKTRRDIGSRNSKNNRRNQAVFWVKKFEVANYSSFERALRGESTDTKIIFIG